MKYKFSGTLIFLFAFIVSALILIEVRDTVDLWKSILILVAMIISHISGVLVLGDKYDK